MRKNNANWKRAYNKLAEEFFSLQEEYDLLKGEYEAYKKLPATDPWAGCACGSSSTCGTTFTVDKSGVIDRPNLTEGRYTVLIKKETT